MKKKNHSAWLEGESYHRIRNEMLGSHAWKAASHLQRSMVFALLYELGRHKGKDNGNLIFTDRDFRAWGFSFGAINPNLNAAEALGLLAFKKGRPGTKGYGRARRFLIPFMPILDDDGKEIAPPSDPWARFSTTKEAKMAAKSAYKRAKNSPLCSRNRSTRLVLRKSEHVAAKRNRKSSAEMPMDIGSAQSEIGARSRSEEANHTLPARDGGQVGLQGRVPWAMREFSCVGTGKCTISKDPDALREFSCVSSRVRFPLIRLVA